MVAGSDSTPPCSSRLLLTCFSIECFSIESSGTAAVQQRLVRAHAVGGELAAGVLGAVGVGGGSSDVEPTCATLLSSSSAILTTDVRTPDGAHDALRQLRRELVEEVGGEGGVLAEELDGEIVGHTQHLHPLPARRHADVARPGVPSRKPPMPMSSPEQCSATTVDVPSRTATRSSVPDSMR